MNTNEHGPLVSVGIPTFSRPEELKLALEGITGQTYKNLEIIVSDNATSGDSVDRLMHEFLARDARIRYIRQSENRGSTYNFQFVLDSANGEFFVWAADDDFREPDFVATLVALMQASPNAELAFCDFIEITNFGEPARGCSSHNQLFRPFTSRNIFVRLIRYFLQLETKGKANLMYGLMRRHSLRGFKWLNFLQMYGEYGADMLFVFSLLTRGHLVLTERRLYKCTVGNKKEGRTVLPTSVRQKVAVTFLTLKSQIDYSLQYISILKGPICILFVVLWPIKVMDIILRIFLFTEIRNAFHRIKRRQRTKQQTR